jgi:hypothetical protein
LPAASRDADGLPQDTADFFKSMFADDPASLGHVNDNSICGTVWSYVRACELAEIELKEWRAQRKAEGNKASTALMAWKKLITRLANLLSASGFRATSRKDGLSPFVALITATQVCVCEMTGCARLFRFLEQMNASTSGMAQQISKVLGAKRSKVPPIAAPRTRRRKHVELQEPDLS